MNMRIPTLVTNTVSKIRNMNPKEKKELIYGALGAKILFTYVGYKAIKAKRNAQAEENNPNVTSPVNDAQMDDTLKLDINS